MIDESVIENGRRLFQSAENLRSASLDLDAMMESIWEIIADENFAGGSVENAKKEDDTWGTDWVTPIWTGNGKVKRIGRGRALLGTITYIVRICGNGASAVKPLDLPWLDQACLLVGWHKCDDYWGAEDFEPSEEKNLHHRGGGVWAYQDEEDQVDYGYFFALPLFALKDEVDLKRFVLSPLKILFEAEDIGDALESALRHVPALLPKAG
jgi:hypothetical protein